MNPLPKPISQFLKEKHIVSFTAHYREDFGQPTVSTLLMSKKHA